MIGRAEDKSAACEAGCPQCSAPGKGVQQAEGRLSGWRLSAAALGAFLGPLCFALAGSALAGGGQAARGIGAGAGLAVGLAAAICVGRLIGRGRKEAA